MNSSFVDKEFGSGKYVSLFNKPNWLFKFDPRKPMTFFVFSIKNLKNIKLIKLFYFFDKFLP